MSISIMRIYSKILPIILAFIFLVSNVADSFAQPLPYKRVKSRNPYLITNIFSSAEESSASASRASAITKANRIAFIVLLKNLGLSEQLKDQISDIQIAEAVYSRQIIDEKIAGNYYSAKFNIAFLKSTISALLDANETQKVSVAQEETFLLFPVENIRGKPILWERNNAWRNALQETINFSNIRNIQLPVGDYADIVSVKPEDLQDSTFGDFSSILNRYNVQSAIIAYFDFDDIENKANILLNIIRHSGNKIVKLSFVNSKNLSRAGLLLKVSERTVEHILTDTAPEISKISKIRDGHIDRKILLNVDIIDLQDWIITKRKLERMTFVEKLKLESISRNVAKVNITHNADARSIGVLFAREGFILRQNRQGEYFLTPQIE